MKIKMLFATGTWKKGEVVDLPEPRAQWLIRVKAAVAVDEPQIEQAIAEPAAETAEAKPNKRRRGRPRKVQAPAAKDT